MELSLMSLGDLVQDPITGTLLSEAERHRMVVDAAIVADQSGFYGINIGEHHGIDYVFSAPPVLLAAIAEHTTRLRLGTAVTLVANLDAFRAAEDYATVDVLSGGRVEIVAGRGNFFVSTYTLFGQDVAESHERFEEALELICQLWSGQPVSWQGRFRPAIDRVRLTPAPLQPSPLPISIGGGSSDATALLSARLGLRLMLPSAFGNPENFRGVTDTYLEAFAQAGHAHAPSVGACWHVNVAPTSQAAKQRFEPRYRGYHAWMQALLKQVNPAVPDYLLKPFDYDWLLSNGPAIAGSPAEVAERLQKLGEMLDADLHLLYMDMGGMPADEYLEMVELVGAEVLPLLPR
jgi:alkanesulfonate monooxygenase SsuD/methylene tetrahydromethanopterin reductase-like flavin-dependent oxidoreductase (luciferase family)